MKLTKQRISNMVSNENALVPSGKSIHRAIGNAQWRWWQLAASNRSTARQPNVYANAGIQQCLSALVLIPIWAIMAFQKFGPSQIHAIVGLLWLSLLVLVVAFYRQHRHQVLEVEASESGLILRSAFLERQIRWLDIADFFPAGTIEPGEYLLQCRSGEEFLLPNELTDSDKLFELIHGRMAPPAITYNLNYRLPDGYFDQAKVCVVVVLAAIALTILSSLVNPAASAGVGNLVSLILLAVLAALALAWCWLNLMKTPQLIRAGQSGLYIKSGTQGQFVPWDQISDIKKIAGWLIVNSRSGWFVLFASKKEPLNEKLLEHKQTVLMLNQRRP